MRAALAMSLDPFLSPQMFLKLSMGVGLAMTFLHLPQSIYSCVSPSESQDSTIICKTRRHHGARANEERSNIISVVYAYILRRMHFLTQQQPL